MNKEIETACPNPSCQKAQTDFVEKINKILFGTDENSGWSKKLKDLEICIRARVTKTWLIGTAITVVGVLCVVFIPMVSGAIKNIREVSDSNIKLEERMASTKEKLADVDTTHRDHVSDVEDRNAEAHKEFIKLHNEDIKTIKTELTTLIADSEERIKEHIDLRIRAVIGEVNGNKKPTFNPEVLK